MIPQMAHPEYAARRSPTPIVLGTLGTIAAVFAAASTYVPWFAIEVGVMHPDGGMLLAVALPLLLVVALAGFGLSVAALVVSTLSRSGLGLSLGVAGVAISAFHLIALITLARAGLFGFWFGF